MIYYHKSRLDNLSKRHERTHELTDYFVDHDNFLTSRKVLFESQPKKVGRAHQDTQRLILVFIFQIKFIHIYLVYR